MRTLTEILKEESTDNEKLSEFIFEDNGKIKVDWKKMHQYIEENAQNEPLMAIDKAYEALIELGILSHKADKNYLLTDGDFIQNPMWGFEPLYFTRIEDVKEYNEAEYSHRMDSTFIFKGI